MKSFTITLCKPCKLFVNMWTFNFCSIQKVSNGFKKNYFNKPSILIIIALSAIIDESCNLKVYHWLWVVRSAYDIFHQQRWRPMTSRAICALSVNVVNVWVLRETIKQFKQRIIAIVLLLYFQVIYIDIWIFQTAVSFEVPFKGKVNFLVFGTVWMFLPNKNIK